MPKIYGLVWSPIDRFVLLCSVSDWSRGKHLLFQSALCRGWLKMPIKHNIDNLDILGDPEVTANIYCKSRNLPNTDTPICSTDLR